MVIPASEMKEAVNDIARDFAFVGFDVLGCLPHGRIQTDEDFTMLESDHIGRRGVCHELTMHFGNTLVRDEGDFDHLQVLQRCFR